MNGDQFRELEPDQQVALVESRGSKAQAMMRLPRVGLWPRAACIRNSRRSEP